jgi:hypothetical protein
VCHAGGAQHRVDADTSWPLAYRHDRDDVWRRVHLAELDRDRDDELGFNIGSWRGAGSISVLNRGGQVLVYHRVQ